MTPSELERWLDTDESKAAGQKADGGGESTGHRSGRRLVGILGKSRDERTEADQEHLERAEAYISRHLAQKPDKPKAELEGMTWTHSLRNWGHDPLK